MSPICTIPMPSLPQEIVVYHIAPLLGVDDLISLLQAFDLEVTKGIYERFFDDNTEFHEYSAKTLYERAHSWIYAVGLCGLRKFPAVLTNSAKAVGDHIAKIRGGTPVGLQVLTLDSKAYSMGAAFRGNTELRPVGAWEGITGNEFDEAVVMSELERQKAEEVYASKEGWMKRYARHFEEPVQFFDADSPIEIVVAVDTRGMLWEYDSIARKLCPVLLTKGNSPEIIEEPVSKLRGSFEFGLACQLDSGRIIAWNATNKYARPVFHRAQMHTIYCGGVHVKDFTVTFSYLVYLTTEGAVAAVFADFKRTDKLAEVNKLGPFVRLSSRGQQLALLGADGTVVVVSLSLGSDGYTLVQNIHLINVLRGLDVVSVSAGLSHFLALTRQGDVYVWGREEVAGVHFLGLGAPPEALEMDGVRMSLNNDNCLVAEKPVKLRLPGKAYSVHAGDFCSAILVYTGTM